MESNRQHHDEMAPKNMDDFDQFEESELEDLYSWIDGIPLSRPKKNINRDFSDGVLVAEVVKHHLPKKCDLHNYAPANSAKQKMQNWNLLNKKVFTKLNFQLSQDVINSVATCKYGVIEKVLLMLRVKISKALWESSQKPKGDQAPPRLLNDKPEADQNFPGNTRQGLTSNNSQTAAGKHQQQQQHLHHKGSNSRIPFPSNETIPRILLEEKEQENLAKEETIQILQAKIKRLEHLVQLKDLRIDDLQGRLEQVRPTGNHRRQ